MEGMGPGRLATILGHVLPASRLADIGAGDGQLARMAAAAGVKVIATEAKPGPYERLRQRLAGSPGCEVRFGNGLSPLAPGEADVIVVAGMGARTICRILEERESVARVARKVILQPMRSADPIRHLLVAGGWSWSLEDLAYEGEHFYEILVVERGAKPLGWDPARQPLGPLLSARRDLLGQAFRTARLGRLKELAAQRRRAGRSVLHLEELMARIRKAATTSSNLGGTDS